MEDFYKKFRENIVNRPEPENDPRLWERLKNDLDAQQARPLPAYGWRWATAAAVLLFMGASTFFYLKLNQAQQMIAANNDLIARMVAQKDTVFETRIVFKTDTIYKVVNKIEKKIEYIPGLAHENHFKIKKANPPSLLGAQYGSPKNIVQNIWSDNPYISPTANHWLQKKEKEIEKNKHGLAAPAALIEDVALLEMPAPRYLPIKEPKLANYTAPDKIIVQKKKKALRHYLYAMQPKGFVAGMAGGWANSINRNLDEHKGSSLGLHTALSFSPNLQLWVDGAFIKTGFGAERTGAEFGVPTVQPPSDDFTFVKAEVSQSSLEYSVGMQYLLNPKGKWKPFFGAGFASLSLLSYSIGYEYKNEVTDENWEFEKELGKDEINTEFFLLHAGLEYEISNSWQLVLKGSYRTDLDNPGLQTPSLIRFQGGVNYSF